VRWFGWLVVALIACRSKDEAGDRVPAADTDTDADSDSDRDTSLPEDTGPFPSPEVCDDGRDNDLDLNVDCADPDCASVCDADGDGVVGAAFGGQDCDDTHASVHPLAPEICDGLDNDCDGATDGDDPGLDPSGALPRFEDVDGDGYGDRPGLVCAETFGWVDVGGDCDDANLAVNPAAQEICDGDVDDDCDGQADDDDPGTDPATETTFWRDGDSDGYGDPTAPVQACAEGPTTASNRDDCDDGDRHAHPGGVEQCGDGIDQDCDGSDLSC
jgi:hypothetical protein